MEKTRKAEISMIIVDGGPSSVDPGFLPPLERQIYDEMNAGFEPLYYSSMADLLFELRLRAQTVKSAEALSQSGIQFSTFNRSRCNDQYWIRTPNGGFQLRFGITPAEGIRDIFANGELYATECATAIVIILYKAVLDTIGENAFNAHFADLLLYDWQYDKDLKLYSKKKFKGIYPGDVVYFTNPDYDRQTPWWIGENAVKLIGDLYYGHGAGIKSEQEMIESLNEKRFPGSYRSAYLSDDAVGLDYAYIQRLTDWNGPMLPYSLPPILQSSASPV